MDTLCFLGDVPYRVMCLPMQATWDVALPLAVRWSGLGLCVLIDDCWFVYSFQPLILGWEGWIPSDPGLPRDRQQVFYPVVEQSTPTLILGWTPQ